MASYLPHEQSSASNSEYTPLTKEERRILGKKIKSLHQKYMSGLIMILNINKSQKSQVVQFDLNELSPKISRELEKYVDECLSKSS